MPRPPSRSRQQYLWTSSSDRGEATGGRNMQANSNSFLRHAYSLVAAAAALAVVFPSLAEARDTSTVSGGYQHSCVVTGDSTVKCFGYNGNGELGLGDTVDRGSGSGDMGDSLPDVDLGTDAVATAVSAGWQHTCALLEGGSVKCWGRNDYGELGQGDTITRGGDPATMGANLTSVDLGTAPSDNGGAVAIAVTTGQQFTCVLVEGGRVKCFGRNDEGQCGRGNLDVNVGSSEGDMGDDLPYIDLGTDVEVVSISSGTSSTCAALLGGGIKCWGGNNYGGLGVGDSYNVGDEAHDMGDNVREVDFGKDEVGLYVVYGLRHACAILLGGNVKCWGDNRSGELGYGHVDTIGDDDSEMGDDLPLVDFGAGNTATSLSLGESHSCAILSDGSTRCWGKGFHGQLGGGNYYAKGKKPDEMGDALAAIDLGTNITVASLAAGSDHTCAALGDGSLKCWGLNKLGALGIGDTDNRGDGSGEMGDDLPAVSLGTGVTVAIDPEAEYLLTPAPTPAPTAPITATLPPTPQSSTDQPQADASSPKPSTETTTPSPTSPRIISPTPAPSPPPTPTPTLAVEIARGGFEEFADDVGVSFTQGIAIAAGIPLIALLLCCFCARRRKRGAAAGSRDSWQKGGESSGLGGLGGHLGGTAPVAGAGGGGGDNNRALSRSGGLHKAGTKVHPDSSNSSPPSIVVAPVHGSRSKRRESGAINPAGHLVVGEGAARAPSAPKDKRRGDAEAHGRRRSDPRESDTAFAMTSLESFPVDVESGGASSESSGGGGTGRSSSPPGYEEDDVVDDAAASTFEARFSNRISRPGMSSAEEDDELSENGWGSSFSRSQGASFPPVNYDEFLRR